MFASAAAAAKNRGRFAHRAEQRQLDEPFLASLAVSHKRKEKKGVFSDVLFDVVIIGGEQLMQPSY